jgi:hypothetical protein
MTERDRVTCPFCDAEIGMVVYADNGIHPQSDCPLSTFSFRREQWDMRPPKKEAPQGKAILSEVEWLRETIKELIQQHNKIFVPFEKETPGEK